MDFIERVFSIAPDGGSGSTELTIISGVVLIAIVVAWRHMTAACAYRKPYSTVFGPT
jgi:hypothetical protein